MVKSSISLKLLNILLCHNLFRTAIEARYYRNRGCFESLSSDDGVWCSEFELVSLSYGVWYNFCISVLGLAHDQATWKLYKSLLKQSGVYVFRLNFDKICLICDCPTKLSIDSENLPHALGEPAIQFIDGESLYFYHGRRLPEKYKKLHPSKWQVQWILEEDNAELRRILI